MRKIIILSAIALTLCACKKEEKTAAPVQQVSIDDLAAKSMKSTEDWTRDLKVYIDDVLVCANASPVQTKYVFRADAFENPSIALILLKSEDDKIYACSIEEGQPAPHFKQVNVVPQEKAPRFYPGNLPKADSCLLNTRVLDNTGHTAGWLSKITC